MKQQKWKNGTTAPPPKARFAPAHTQMAKQKGTPQPSNAKKGDRTPTAKKATTKTKLSKQKYVMFLS